MAFIKKRGNVYYIYWTQNSRKHGRSLRTKSKRQADEYLREFEYQLAARQLGQAADIGLDRLRDEYLAHSKTTKSPSTYERSDLPRVNRFVDYLAHHGVALASQITQAHVERYQELIIKQLSPASVRNCVFTASGLLSFAVRRGYLSVNVAKSVDKIKAPKNPPRYLSFDEWAIVRTVAEDTSLWPLVATAYYTGFRNSELRYLTWPEIGFDRDVITLTNKEGFTLKSKQSRTVPLNGDLKAILSPMRQRRGYCFADDRGRQFGATQLTRAFKRLIVKPCGLPHFSLHTLRHTFASHLVMKGVDIYRVSQWLGHSSVNTTMIYAHLAPQDDQINVL